MSLSLLAPLFLAGLALEAVPWLIHRIQRPERRPVRFSSLMFVPRMDKEVVQRRKLQHLLLLMMRMAILALLAFAFSRPFFPRKNVAVAGSAAETSHVLLIDRSFSMGTESWMEEARTQALMTIESIPANESVALVTFGETAEVLMPSSKANDSGNGREMAKRQIEGIEISQEGTSYRSALMMARRELESA